MRDFRDAKAMAQTLSEALSAKSVSLSHSESLELIARVLGLRDWNVLAARIQASQPVGAGPRNSAPEASPPPSSGADLPIFPMRDFVLFPQMTVPVFVSRDKTRRAVEHAMAGDRRVLVVAQRQATDDDPGNLDSLYPVGVTASVINCQTQVDGVLKVSVSAFQRAAILHLVNADFLAAEIAPVEEQRRQSAEAVARSSAVLDTYQSYANIDFSSLPRRAKARLGLPSIGDPGVLADTLAPLLSISIEQKQQLLETSDVVARLEKILDLMKAGRPENGPEPAG
ncbi:MAG: endopeptidase La [Mesorhizobium sp.]|uniref:LON peptidase substrate-binding domain-containing protein n=1 Tax=Mesorhizobium sp. TaxID=1871066 RepID=UPI000FE416CB|nr:LON peptidase substrate-binding domain-containing protein [Mesorhizobium sp.]RWN59559.1 MAG: endopeptidase La [Mesorhizobium sp.]RWO45908.1 MAG: endopeptidase La [Mesorhizobium sp.]TIN77858.1 MAG: endopeptidase La [Mesorhizobium sp.]TJV59011.1 MAG: endopeptidase La [Mesorhizobium sp.]